MPSWSVLSFMVVLFLLCCSWLIVMALLVWYNVLPRWYITFEMVMYVCIENKKQGKQMMHWVYIYEDGENDLRLALSTDVGTIISNLKTKMRIVYLRQFELPFDALAHKHLLEDLSRKSALHWINKHKEETEIWLRISREIRNKIDWLWKMNCHL